MLPIWVTNWFDELITLNANSHEKIADTITMNQTISNMKYKV